MTPPDPKCAHCRPAPVAERRGPMPEHAIAWADWADILASDHREGWSYGRFGMHGERGRTLFVYGWLRNGLGIFVRGGRLLLRSNYPTITPSVETQLVHMVILRQGTVLATFANLDIAFPAVELAEKVADWWAIDSEESPAMADAVKRTNEAWLACGFGRSLDRTAVANDGHHIDCLIVPRPDLLNDGRPEKLS